MNSSDPPPLTKDSVPPRAERRLWRTGCAVLVGLGVLVIVALLLAWWLYETGPRRGGALAPSSGDHGASCLGVVAGGRSAVGTTAGTR